jgi:CoA:oxalate CoA-transferase
MLSGLRVLDFTRVMSGPYCTAMLADLGADVIKVEQPGEGDISRHVAPHVDGLSSYFSLLNRGKRSVTLDLKNPRAIELIVDLTRKSDVLVENFRPGVMERLGLGYEALSAANPRLVYASISGFGQEGPFARLPAYDLIVQAMSGLMNVTGERDGRSMAVGESIADICAGIFASWGILAALLERSRSGEGRYLEIAMLDCMFSMLITPLSRKLATGTEPVRMGNRHPVTYPCDSFSARDGDLVLVCLGDAAFHDFCRAIERPDLIRDPRFATNEDRNVHEEELRRIIADWCSERSRQAVIEILRNGGVPCAPVWGLGDLLSSGHVESRGLLKQRDAGEAGVLASVAQPVRFSGSPAATGTPPPKLGEHTEEVLGTLLGLDRDEIESLRSTKVIGSREDI